MNFLVTSSVAQQNKYISKLLRRVRDSLTEVPYSRLGHRVLDKDLYRLPVLVASPIGDHGVRGMYGGD